MGFHQFSLGMCLVVMIMMIALKTNSGRAAVLVKSNPTYECNGLLNNGCSRMGQQDLESSAESELDFFMYEAHVIRILQGDQKVTANALDPGHAVQSKCSPSYTNCIAKGDQNAKCKNAFGCRGQL